MSGDVWLITGAQASGKSATAEALAGSFERGVHVRGGAFYRWAVTGWVHFDDVARREARRLLDLRYRLSGVVADEYAAAGFSVVAQDNVYGPDVTAWIGRVRARPLHLVVLRPSVAVLHAREDERCARTGKVAYRDGYTPERNDADVASTPHVGLWLDNSAMTVEETVEEILARRDEAIVG